MLSIVMDTNVLVSAVGWKGNERMVLERCIFGDYTLIISKEIIDELIAVLGRPKFNFIPTAKKAELLTMLAQIGEMVVLKEKVDIIKEDPADNKILETALAGKATYIISGDHHLLNLKLYRGMNILNAKNFLDSFL